MSQDNFYQACETGNLAEVNRLLEDSSVDPAINTNYAIRWASKNGHLEVVKRLLQDPRVGLSADYAYAVRWASESGHIEVVKRLLRHINESKRIV